MTLTLPMGPSTNNLFKNVSRGGRVVDGYDAMDDFARSLEVGYIAIRERIAAGGPGWEPSK